MNLKENIQAVTDAKEKLETHCMCAKFEETETHFKIAYPVCMYPNGAQASKSMGKAAALLRLLEVAERHWKENGISK
jgi:predicted carbohydrate-binding protein with CBM5 and CBM33 domain